MVPSATKSNLKIAIVFSPDPVYLTPFIYKIIERYHHHISLVIITEGSIIKKKSFYAKLSYLLALFLIVGVLRCLGNIYKMLIQASQSQKKIEMLCREKQIKFLRVKTINEERTIFALKDEEIDLLFNQSHHIVKQEALHAVKVAAFNRHGALLPRYRGRLAPFWQLYNGEQYGGMTYHVLDDGIDSGPIIHQEVIPIEKGETVNSLIDKMFEQAIVHFQSVIDFFSRDDYASHFRENRSSEMTYYGSPTLTDAIRFRLRRLV